MEEKTFKKVLVIVILIGLFILTFFMLRSIALSICSGFILAYVFTPLFKKLNKKIKSKNLSALIVLAGILILLIVPLIFIIPIAARQMIDSYAYLQGKDLTPVFKSIFPNLFSSPEVSADISAMISSLTSNLAGAFLSVFKDIMFNLPNLFLQGAVILFTFFFILRDHELLIGYINSISPLPKEYHKRLADKFKQVTNSVLYGHVIVGIIQGLVAGIGYLIFGVSGVLLLTFFTILVSMIPTIGAWLIWVPVDIYLFSSGHVNAGIGLLIYGVFIVSWIDNIVRPIIVSKLSKINSGLVLIGMLGGLYAFGIVGIVLGPLILSYLILITEFYKERGFKSIIVQECPKNPSTHESTSAG